MSSEIESAQLGTMLRSHVERALMQIWEKTELVTDSDDDYPFHSQTSACWVSVIEADVPSVRVFAHAAIGVPRSVKMLAEVNELCRRSRWTKVYWVHGIVVVDSALPWTLVNRQSLEMQMSSVCTIADDIGTMLAAVFGGETPFSDEDASADEDSDAA